jgi:glycosyltransferase involved in cell wall biosynthesis
MNILYVTTIGGTMGFFKELIHRLISEGNTVDIATNETDSKVPECYREWGCRVYPIECTRSVVCKGNFNAIRELREVVSKNTYDIVHCHTPIAAACVRVACRRLRKNGMKVVYTAHGFHFFKGAPLKNWLFYYPVEKLLSYWTDCLITINKEDYGRAKKKFHARKTVYIPGVGVDTKKFNSGLIDIGEKRASLGVMDNEIMLLSVGELSRRKNHEIVIRALKELNYPTVKYFIAGQGELQEYLSGLIKNYGLEDKIFLLGYRTDISELCQAADLFIFPSKQEGMPVALMEAIACKTPVYCSNIRGNVELVHNKDFLFDPTNKEKLVSGLRNIIGENKSEELKRKRSKEILENYNRLLCFDLNHVNTQMNSLYCNQGGGTIEL